METVGVTNGAAEPADRPPGGGIENAQLQNGFSTPCVQPAFKTGDHIVTTASFDRRLHAGVVVELRGVEDGSIEYFIHYDHWDKRTDEWVRHERVQPFSDELASQCALKRPSGEEDDGSKRMTRRHRGRLEHSSIKGEFSVLDFKDGKVTGTDADGDHRHPLRARYTETVNYGPHVMSAWYHSPLPPPFDKLAHLFVCPYTLKYFRKRRQLEQYIAALPLPERKPPGQCIYHSPPPGRQYRLSTPEQPTLTAACDPPVTVYEVDGAQHKLYCQNLCLLSKIFLDGKTLVWEVHEFLFYVLCEATAEGEAMVGYFSREKKSEVNHLACILTMPHRQRKGYGSLLIDFSYTLARIAEKPGSPERPLSDLGQQAFMEYWERELIQALLEVPAGAHCDVAALARRSGIAHHDIVEALAQPGARLEELKIVVWKRTGYDVDVKSVEALQALYQLLTEGKHRLVVAPEYLDATFKERITPPPHHGHTHGR